MSKKPKTKGTFEFEGNEIDYAWHKNHLTVSTHLSRAKLTFQIFQSAGVEREFPAAFAKDVFEHAVLAGVTDSEMHNIHRLDAAVGFPVYGATITRAKSVDKPALKRAPLAKPEPPRASAYLRSAIIKLNTKDLSS